MTLDEAGRQNARFMTHEQFRRLVNNIESDGAMTSVPFAMWSEQHGRYVVLSGNHRTKAAREAGTGPQPYLVTHDTLSEERIRAIQLSHNAIEGQDDIAVLKSIYESIGDIDQKMYCGLDDKTLELLEEVGIAAIKEAQLEYYMVAILFLPPEVEKAKASFEEIRKMLKPKEWWAARSEQYEGFSKSLEEIDKAHDIMNVAAAFQVMLSVYERNKTDLQEGWFDEQEQKLRHKGRVPLSSIFGDDSVPAKMAEAILGKVQQMVRAGAVQPDNPMAALGVLVGYEE